MLISAEDPLSGYSTCLAVDAVYTYGIDSIVFANDDVIAKDDVYSDPEANG